VRTANRGCGWVPSRANRYASFSSLPPLDTFAFGAMQVGAAAAATFAGHSEAVGLIAAALSAGAVVGGLVYGTRLTAMIGRNQLALLHLAGGLVLIVASSAPGLLALGLLFAIFGLLSGPRDALQQLLLNDAGPSRSRTETFAWLNTFMWGGFGLGTAVAGRLAGDPPSALRSGAAAGLLAALVVLGQQRLRRATDDAGLAA
jgi:hypothetical protein